MKYNMAQNNIIQLVQAECTNIVRALVNIVAIKLCIIFSLSATYFSYNLAELP